jgi:glycine cleavage system H protein
MECNGCEFRPELYYDGEFQIWVRIEEGGLLAIGMTDPAQTIAGKILHVRVRRPGTPRPAGRPVATIESGKWAGPVPNPFDCTIAAANPAVLEEPALLNRRPYDAWIARVAPARPVPEALAGLLTGRAAWTAFEARVKRDDVRCGRLDG